MPANRSKKVGHKWTPEQHANFAKSMEKRKKLGEKLLRKTVKVKPLHQDEAAEANHAYLSSLADQEDEQREVRRMIKYLVGKLED